MHYPRWAVAAALISAAFALSACGAGTSPASAGPGTSGIAGAQHVAEQNRLTVVGIHSKAAPQCNTSLFPSGCFSFSNSKGLLLDWCYGPPSDPCGETAGLSNWSGGVTRVKNGALVKAFHVTYVGPFYCSPSTCGTGFGSFEEDRMAPHKHKPLKLTNRYVYKQTVNACTSSSCVTLGTVGINVVP